MSSAARKSAREVLTWPEFKGERTLLPLAIAFQGGARLKTTDSCPERPYLWDMDAWEVWFRWMVDQRLECMREAMMRFYRMQGGAR